MKPTTRMMAPLLAAALMVGETAVRQPRRITLSERKLTKSQQKRKRRRRAAKKARKSNR